MSDQEIMKYSMQEIIDLDKTNKIDLYSYLYDEFYEGRITDPRLYWHFLLDEREDISKVCFRILSSLIPDSIELFDYAIQFLNADTDETDKQSTIISFLPALNLGERQKSLALTVLFTLYNNPKTSSLLRANCFCSILALKFALSTSELVKINGALIVDFDDINFEKFSEYPL